MHTPLPGSEMNSQPFSVLTGGSESVRTLRGARSGLAIAAVAAAPASASAAMTTSRRPIGSDTTAPKVHHRSSPSPPSRPRSRGPAAVIAQT